MPEIRSGRVNAHLFLFGTDKDKQNRCDLKAKPDRYKERILPV
ncbi:hypothetical protein [Rhodohalobacter halophilus]|nr:hypothetical protein [Rhodohalobacter halophilus]